MFVAVVSVLAEISAVGVVAIRSVEWQQLGLLAPLLTVAGSLNLASV